MRELRKRLTEMRRITRPVIMGQGYPWGSTVKVCGERGHIGKEYLQLVLGGLPGGGDSALLLTWPDLQPLFMGPWEDPSPEPEL